MAKKEYKKTKAQLKKEEEAVFAEFGIGTGEESLRALIRGQRKINGKLYRAIDLILDSLKAQSGKAPDPALVEAKNENDGVPGPPPGCE
jgi:hypothetical protein